MSSSWVYATHWGGAAGGESFSSSSSLVVTPEAKEETSSPPEEAICRADPAGSWFFLFPLAHPVLWSMCKQHVASFWVAGEIDLSADLGHWHNRLKRI